MKAIALLVGGRTYAQAASELGVDRTTIFRWRREPEFSGELKRRLEEVLDAVAMRTRAAMLKSSDLLAQALKSEQAFNWAFKVMNSKRVWDLASTMPEIGGE